jgi:hypothetical protein
MKNIYILLLCCSAAIAQTKLIAHKSHSGSMATFTTAFNNNLFDMGESNFGEPALERRYTIDSIILRPDDSAIVISSIKELWWGTPKSQIEFKPGRDTLYNHPLLSKRHSKDSIAVKVYTKNLEDPVLVNYDNDNFKKNSLPAVHNNDNGTPNMPLMVAALAAISILFGFVFYMVHKLKLARLA